MKKAGRHPKNGSAAATERIQIRVTPQTKRKIQAHNVDLALIVDGAVRGLPEVISDDLPRAS